MIRRIIDAILTAVEAAGDKGVFDGQLYIMLQSILGEVWTLDVHTSVIGTMVSTGQLTNTNHLLRRGATPSPTLARPALDPRGPRICECPVTVGALSTEWYAVPSCPACLLPRSQP